MNPMKIRPFYTFYGCEWLLPNNENSGRGQLFLQKYLYKAEAQGPLTNK